MRNASSQRVWPDAHLQPHFRREDSLELAVVAQVRGDFHGVDGNLNPQENDVTWHKLHATVWPCSRNLVHFPPFCAHPRSLQGDTHAPQGQQMRRTISATTGQEKQHRDDCAEKETPTLRQPTTQRITLQSAIPCVT